MGTNLFVGNLSFRTSEESLHEWFSQIGEVTSARIIMDKFSGRSRGFGFVEMANEADAQRAIDELNGKELEGREINVRIANDKPERSEYKPRGDFAPRSGGYQGGNSRGGDRGGFRGGNNRGGNRGGFRGDRGGFRDDRGSSFDNDMF